MFLPLLLLCCAASGAAGSRGEPGGEGLGLEEDNQENIMSQLLGDYDKVKTLSSGSDCVCRCIVRPIKRSDCDRIHDDAAMARDFYTVETVTKGTDCQRCECFAPPSAVNPCEGEYRFLKLQEVGRDVKLSSILDLLEGSMYGMDLLKLHSITTKLLDRMDNMETFAHNLTKRQKEKEREKDLRSQQRQDKKKRTHLLEQKVDHHVRVQPKKNQGQNIPEQQQPLTNKTGQDLKVQAGAKQPRTSPVLRGVTFYRAGAPRERGHGQTSPLPSVDQKPPLPRRLDLPAGDPTVTAKTPTPPGTQTSKTPTPPGTHTPKTPTPPGTHTPKTPTPPGTHTPKTPTPPGTHTPKTPTPPGTHTPKTPTTPGTHTPKTPTPPGTHTPKTPTTPGTHTPKTPTTPGTHTPKTPTTPGTHTQKTPTPPGTHTPKTPTTPGTHTPKTPTTPGTQTPKRRLTPLSTSVAPTTFQPHATRNTISSTSTMTPGLTPPAITTSRTSTTTPNQPTTPALAPPPASRAALTSPHTAATVATGKSRLSWTESSMDKHKPTKKPDVCKDTISAISEPVEQNSYGLSDGAWMKDPRGHGKVIYLTNGHYGNSLLEFRDLDTFRSGVPSNSYQLPYSFTGSGHVVYGGAMFYTRAFTRDLIRYDLRRRAVSAWTTLQDAVLEELGTHTHTQIRFLVDESGLWLLYPAPDSEGFHQEVMLLTRIRPRDLQPIHSFRTGLRRGRYGDSFLVCGVLYAVDTVDRLHANVTYAFDTHTLTHTVPTLAFTNRYAHTAQLAYCPLDRLLYAWDHGHQLTYRLLFAY